MKKIASFFGIEYTSIAEQITKTRGTPKKYDIGTVFEFAEGNGFPKFVLDRKNNKPRLLFKVIPDLKCLDNLVTLKTILVNGEVPSKSPYFAYAVPIGYGKLTPEQYIGLGIESDSDVHFAVYVFKEECRTLTTILKNDSIQGILDGSYNFNYSQRIQIKNNLINLYYTLEDLSELYEKVPYRILHYDIKPDNYLVDNDNNIYTVDFDQSGFLKTNKSELVRPTADLSQYDYLFLPYEVVTPKENAMYDTDKRLWALKEIYTEIWMAWLLLFNVLTGLPNPFMFCRSYDHKTIFEFLRSNNITDLFSEKTYEKGDRFNKHNNGTKKQYIQNLITHLNKSLTKGQKEIMNTIFIKGFYSFPDRPDFYRYKTEFSKY